MSSTEADVTDEMPPKTRRRPAAGQVRWLWLSALVIVIDQISKIVVSHHMSLFQSVPVTSFFRFTLLHNSGAAFSFLAGASGWQRWFFICLGLVISIIILIWLRRMPRHDRRLLGIGIALVLGGALGNVIDRVAYGYVIDFIDFFYNNWHFWPFNVADSAITTGAALVILDALISSRKKSATQDNSSLPPSDEG
jgi:signal peptidase II